MWLVKENTLNSIQAKEKMLIIVLKNILLNWWIIVLLVKQWKI